MRFLNSCIVWTQCAVRDERGANIVEYAILLVFIVIVTIAALTLIGQETTSKFEPVQSF